MFLVVTQTKWTFFFSITHFSFITYPTYQNKTGTCFCGSSIQYFFHTFSFRIQIIWEWKSEVSMKSLSGFSLFITAEKHCFQERNFVHVSFFVLDADWKTFSRNLPTFIVISAEYTVINTMRTCRKTQVFGKSCYRRFSLLCFSKQTSLFEFHRSVDVKFRGNRLLNASWLSETLFAVWIFVLSSHCFVF